jgi:hypothetical protein
MGRGIRDRSGLESSLQTALPLGTSSLSSIFNATLNVQGNLHTINHNLEFNHKSLIKSLKTLHDSLRNSSETALKLTLQTLREPISKKTEDEDILKTILSETEKNNKNLSSIKERLNEIEATVLSSTDHLISTLK